MMNNTIFYQELKRNAAIVNDEINSHKERTPMLCDACTALLWLANGAHKEGLLWLIDAQESDRVQGLVLGNEVSQMVELIVDGTDAQVVEDLCLTHYFSRNYAGIEGFLYLVYLSVLLDVQAGMHPRLIKWKIAAMMPDEINEELDRIEAEETAAEQKSSEERWEALFNNPFPLDELSINYYIIRMVDDCLIRMRNEDIQRTLREIPNGDLSLLMKGLSGTALKKIHDNVAARLAVNILDEMESIGSARVKDIAETADKVFQIMLRLAAIQEISLPEHLSKLFMQGETAGEREEYDSTNLKLYFTKMMNRDIQKVLKNVSHDVLGTAMQGWDARLRQLITSNITRQAAEEVSRSMEGRQYTAEEIGQANEQIFEIIRRLEDSSEIMIMGGDMLR